jgi:hypothetical protein
LYNSIMAGPVPAIHVLRAEKEKAWMLQARV